MMLKARRVALWSVLVVLAAYGGVVLWYGAHQSALLYFPERQLEASPEDFGIAYGRVVIPSTDSVQLACWIIPSADTSTLWILYLHGNAGNIAKRGYVEHCAQLHKIGLNILGIDYRGYGESTGIPGERGLYDDARAAYEYLRSAQHVLPGQIIVYGYSLGSAVAVNLAAHVPVAGLIVEGSFTSITDVGQHHYPFLPVGLMLKERYAAIDNIAQVTAPKLFIHAVTDETIPIKFGRALFNAAPNPKTFLEVRGNHNNAHSVEPRLFYGGIQLFVMQLRSGQRQESSPVN